MISRYRVAADRDEAGIILRTAIIGNLSKKVLNVYGIIMARNVLTHIT